MVNISVVQYEVQQLANWQAYEDKIVRLVETAKESGANLLTMGEYAGLELASWTDHNPLHQLTFIQSLLSQYLELFSVLAKEYQVYIQPGTIPVKEQDGFYRNRAYFFSPDGKIVFQDKIFLTPTEVASKVMRPGNTLQLFETELGKIGITICYDIEFPAIATHLTQAGVKLLLVPSCTEKMSGLTRVAICSQARAIENQCYVAQSSLIGKAAWCEAIDMNTGQSGIYCPADKGFPEDGILSQAQLNIPMLIHAKLDWEKLDYVREQGEVFNFQDGKKNINTILSNSTGIKMI